MSTFNLYREPQCHLGDASQAGPWLEHGEKIFGEDFNHIKQWLAHRVQRPGEKINHALVFGGVQGIGKDSLLEPLKYAIGPWNFAEVSPAQALGRFNGFLKSVILRISEARDLGDIDRFAFYDHTKSIIASPPDTLRIDEKNLREYSIPNCCGVIITTNHKSDGIYLPADDRRHFVAWSDLSKEDFTSEYWNKLWAWYSGDGFSQWGFGIKAGKYRAETNGLQHVVLDNLSTHNPPQASPAGKACRSLEPAPPKCDMWLKRDK